MQVKCMRKTMRQTMVVSDEANDVIARGSALLGSCRDQSGAITLAASNLNRPREQSDALYIVGGRESMVHWLQLQAADPRIISPNHGTLFLTIFRKHQTFGKNLTMAMLCPYELNVMSGSWDYTAPVDIRFAQDANAMAGVLQPNGLAAVLATMFRNN